MSSRGRLTDIAGIEIDVERVGAGPPVLLLVGEDGDGAEAAVIADLARDHEVVVPTAPGFGRSPESPRIACIDDIAYLYLDLLDGLDLQGVTVVGFSLGGWIAAEMATKNCERIGRLALVAPVGIKLGGAFDSDIADIYMLPKAELARRLYHDSAFVPDYEALPEEKLEIVARNRIATARFCWSPFMHNPRLRDRLYRVKRPTLLIWGAQDGIVTPDYGRGYANKIRGAGFELLDGAGHLPHVEKPEAFQATLRAFLGNSATV